MRLRLTPRAALGLAGGFAAAAAAAAAADTNGTHGAAATAAAALLLAPPFPPPPQHFRNVKLVRHINVEKAYARERIDVVIENVDDRAHADYFLPFAPPHAGRVGALEASAQAASGPRSSPLRAELAGVDPASATAYYRIPLPEPLAPGQRQTLAIAYYLLSALEPLPAHIAQDDEQYVLLRFSAYAPSAYPTARQKTKLTLPTTNAPDHTRLPAELNAEGRADPQTQGATWTYGPYADREAGAAREVSVRYEFTKPLARCTLLERDVEISHWGGNVATEERLWITNRAAALADPFSRPQYAQSRFRKSPTRALHDIAFPLAPGSVDAYFVDDIGNVSTSNFRTGRREAALHVRPRYPVFGGWSYSFKVGWNADLTGVLRRISGAGPDRFALRLPFFQGPQQAEGLEYARVVTRVVLPEGATDVRFETSLPGLVANRTGLHRTFMDTLGRTTLTLTAVNLVDELRDRTLVVTYHYPASARLRKPLTVTAALALLFVTAWLVGHLDVSIGRKTKRSSSSSSSSSST